MQTIECHIENEIATITLNRPQKANAYTQLMLHTLDEFWTNIEEQARFAIIQANGEKAFCAGADLLEMTQARAEDALDLFSQRVFNRIATSRVMSIAAIQAPALGGGFELALACDLRVATRNTWFSFPEVSKGLIPAAGGCTRLSQLVGTSIAKGVILGRQKITAPQALQWGLIHRMVEKPQFDAFQWASNLLTDSPLAQQLAKEVLSAPSLEKERLAEAILYERKNNRSQKDA